MRGGGGEVAIALGSVYGLTALESAHGSLDVFPSRLGWCMRSVEVMGERCKGMGIDEERFVCRLR